MHQNVLNIIRIEILLEFNFKIIITGCKPTTASVIEVRFSNEEAYHDPSHGGSFWFNACGIASV